MKAFLNIYQVKRFPFILLKKSQIAYPEALGLKDILITADTIVYQGNRVLTKPGSYEDAFSSLRALSNSSHYVYTGVCIRDNNDKAEIPF